MMEDKENLATERVPPTQRRTGGLPGSAKLSRSNLKPTEETSETEGGSPAKVIIWVVIVVVLAVAAYLALRNVLKGPDTGTTTGTPTPTVELTAQDRLVSKDVLADGLAAGKQQDAAYVLTDQTVGKASEAEYGVQGLFVQKYTSF